MEFFSTVSRFLTLVNVTFEQIQMSHFAIYKNESIQKLSKRLFTNFTEKKQSFVFDKEEGAKSLF